MLGETSTYSLKLFKRLKSRAEVVALEWRIAAVVRCGADRSIGGPPATRGVRLRFVSPRHVRSAKPLTSKAPALKARSKLTA